MGLHVLVNTTSRTKRKTRDPKTWIKGIVLDAKELEVSHDHLRLVLKNKRQSASLMARYVKLKQDQQSKGA